MLVHRGLKYCSTLRYRGMFIILLLTGLLMITVSFFLSGRSRFYSGVKYNKGSNICSYHCCCFSDTQLLISLAVCRMFSVGK